LPTATSVAVQSILHSRTKLDEWNLSCRLALLNLRFVALTHVPLEDHLACSTRHGCTLQLADPSQIDFAGILMCCYLTFPPHYRGHAALSQQASTQICQWQAKCGSSSDFPNPHGMLSTEFYPAIIIRFNQIFDSSEIVLNGKLTHALMRLCLVGMNDKYNQSPTYRGDAPTHNDIPGTCQLMQGYTTRPCR
jgi:hypothetical protein